jgi:hypothetical protein
LPTVIVPNRARPIFSGTE